MTSIWKKILKIIKSPYFILGLIVVLAIVLRLLDINKTSFWYDEAFTGDTIKLSWKEMFIVIAKDKVHPPLFYVIARLWSYIFGFTQDSLRGLSVFSGIGGVVLSFFLGKEIFDKKRFPLAGLVSALAIAISPFFITYSNEARSYSFIALLALGLAFSVIKWLDSKEVNEKKKYLIISIALAVVLCATHYLQVIFVIAVACCVIIYKYIFTEKGINRKWLYISLGTVAAFILVLIFSPISQILASHGITGMWWIPEIKFYDVVRVYYAYFLGVVRYMNGVPPMRELSVSIPLLLIASVLFVAHTLGYVYILISKRFKIEEKRHITFFYFLGIITFIGIYMLSAIGFHSFVERYVIAGGIILLVSFWITMSTVLRNWYILIPIGFYVVLILLLKPMPSVPDYRDIAKSLDSMNNVQRYIFTSPTDYVDSEFYMSHTNVYYYYDFEGEYQGWALLDDNNGVSASNVKAGDILIAPAYDLDRFVALGYKEVSEFIPGFYTLQK